MMAYGEHRKWDDGEEIAEQIGASYGTITTYASVARAYPFSNRLEKLSFTHHFRAVAVEGERERPEWRPLSHVIT
jgi:hypothetical protein